VSADQLMQGRIATRGGSFFNDVPIGADIYMLIRVLHDWPDEDCVRILRSCRAGMQNNSLLLLGEEIMEPDPTRGRISGYLIDTQMMAMFGGARGRTESEFRDLFDRTGFSLRRVIPTRSAVSIVEAAPVATAP
jgi:hypothetical protein